MKNLMSSIKLFFIYFSICYNTLLNPFVDIIIPFKTFLRNVNNFEWEFFFLTYPGFHQQNNI